MVYDNNDRGGGRVVVVVASEEWATRRLPWHPQDAFERSAAVRKQSGSRRPCVWHLSKGGPRLTQIGTLG